MQEAVLATTPGAASGAPQSEQRVPPKAPATRIAPGAASGAPQNDPRVPPKASATRNAPGAASGAPQSGLRVPPKASATRSVRGVTLEMSLYVSGLRVASSGGSLDSLACHPKGGFKKPQVPATLYTTPAFPASDKPLRPALLTGLHDATAS